MAKRFRDTTKFDREWYMNLRPRLKSAVDFVLDKCDNAGVWPVNMSTLNVGVNDEKEILLQEILEVDCGKQFLEFEPGKIFCIDFISFQYGTLSESSKPHAQVINLLTKYNLVDRVLKGYPKGIHTLKDKDTDKEKETDKEKDKPLEKSEKPFTPPEEKKYPDDLDWPFEKEKFLADTMWQENYIRINGCTEWRLKQRVAEYLKGIESGEDYKTAVLLKKHFTNWDRKNISQAPMNIGGVVTTLGTYNQLKPQQEPESTVPTEEEKAAAIKAIELQIDNDFTAYCENENCAIKYAVMELDFLIKHSKHFISKSKGREYEAQAITKRMNELNARYDNANALIYSQYERGNIPQGDELNLKAIAKDLALRDYFRELKAKEEQMELTETDKAI